MKEYFNLFVCLVIYLIIAFGLFQLAIWLQKEFNLFS
jgi:hypothetical protein